MNKIKSSLETKLNQINKNTGKPRCRAIGEGAGNWGKKSERPTSQMTHDRREWKDNKVADEWMKKNGNSWRAA